MHLALTVGPNSCTGLLSSGTLSAKICPTYGNTLCISGLSSRERPPWLRKPWSY